MLGLIEPAVQLTLMRVLSVIYESGLVREVNLGDVMRLFGVESSEELDSETMSFEDEDWVQSYISFKEYEQKRQRDKQTDDEDEEVESTAQSSTRVLH